MVQVDAILHEHDYMKSLSCDCPSTHKSLHARMQGQGQTELGGDIRFVCFGVNLAYCHPIISCCLDRERGIVVIGVICDYECGICLNL
jgi:hypothetical protein